MKLTPQDINFFKHLSASESGAYLLGYLKRVEEHAYNSKDWQEGDTKESAARAAKLIRELLIDKVRPNKPTGAGTGDYE